MLKQTLGEDVCAINLPEACRGEGESRTGLRMISSKIHRGRLLPGPAEELMRIYVPPSCPSTHRGTQTQAFMLHWSVMTKGHPGMEASRPFWVLQTLSKQESHWGYWGKRNLRGSEWADPLQVWKGKGQIHRMC